MITELYSNNCSPFVRDQWAEPRKVGKFSAWEMYCDPELGVWESDTFDEVPCYYPLYKYKNLYSHSPIPLIHAKGSFVPDRAYIRMAKQRRLPYISTNRSIDSEIIRVGGPKQSLRSVVSQSEYVGLIANALTKDADAVEKRLPGYTNVILCGGRDSLNLLLLPWKNPVLVASGDPNYPLVSDFVERMGLGFKVVRLKNSKPDDRLAMAAMGSLDLSHFRWSHDLLRIVDELEGKVVFWSGQLGDVFQTTHWTNYLPLDHPVWLARFPVACGMWRIRNMLRANYRKQHGHVTSQHELHEVLYWRGAMWQGVYTGVMKTYTGCPTVSGYHGALMTKLLHKVNLESALVEDIRPQVGALLAGRDVCYPVSNPGPAVSPSMAVMSIARIVRELGECGGRQ